MTTTTASSTSILRWSGMRQARPAHRDAIAWNPKVATDARRQQLRTLSTRGLLAARHLVKAAGINPSVHMNLPANWNINGSSSAQTIDHPSSSYLHPAKEKKRVVLAVDDTHLSELALEWTLENVVDVENGDELLLLHIVAGQSDSIEWKHSGSESSLEEDEVHVLPLPTAALEERWAAKAHDFLKTRFGDRLEARGIPYTVDLVKEYGPNTPAAIGHCICNAAEDIDAAVVVVTHAESFPDTESVTSVSRFVANYSRRPVVMLSEHQLVKEQSAVQKGRVLLFAVTRSLEEMWALDWAQKTVGKAEDSFHLAHVSQELPQDPMLSFETLNLMQTSMMHQGRHIRGHLLPASSALVDGEETSKCVGDALSGLAEQLQADMVFLVNHGEDNMDNFVWHSVTGRCAHLSSCATVVLHGKT